jgi:hypothetical protein
MEQPEVIRGRVDAGILQKADRLFRNDDKGTFIEVLQNARRAGATTVDVTFEEIEAEPNYCLVTVEDNGAGIDDFQNLVTLGRSGWDHETQSMEDPAGMGFFSLCQSGVEVISGSRSVTVSQDVFLGKADAEVTDHAYIAGTRLRFTRPSTSQTLSRVLEAVTRFCPLEVRLNGQILPRHDFLEGAIHRELIDGIEVGFATSFRHNAELYRDENWNFYGAIIHESFPSFSGILNANHTGPALALHVRFNVLETGRIKLQLPDRRGVIRNEFLTQFERKTRAAAYRCFQKQAHHALPFRNWKEARDLGVRLQEAACLLTSWAVSARDTDIEPLFAQGKAAVLPDLNKVLLVNSGLADEYTLQAALHSGAKLDFVLYDEKPEYQGYSWYNALPRLSDIEVVIDGVPYVEYQRHDAKARPIAIELQVRIEKPEGEEQIVSIPAFIHVDAEQINDVDFVAVQQSPWDKDETGPFHLDEFLIWATFMSSDDADCDSWQTQRDYYQEVVEQAISDYFRGPRASLVSQLYRLLDSRVSRQAAQLGVTEIKFSRSTPEEYSWTIQLAGRNGSQL